jgi:phosphinothricin acetyltransferase
VVAGYAYAHAWHQRAAYRYAAEDSVYLRPGRERRGIGKRLLEEVMGELRRQDLHVLMAVITVPNPASVGLHENLGFRKAGQFDEIGFKQGKRLDVGYWELILDGPGEEGGPGGGGPAEGGNGKAAGFEVGGEASPLIRGFGG